MTVSAESSVRIVPTAEFHIPGLHAALDEVAKERRYLAFLGAPAIAAAWEVGMTRIELEVLASNPKAIRLYEKLGFVHEGVKRRARHLDGAWDDNVLMALLAS